MYIPRLTLMVTSREAFRVRYLYKRSLKVGAWERAAVLIRTSIVNGSNPVMKLKELSDHNLEQQEHLRPLTSVSSVHHFP